MSTTSTIADYIQHNRCLGKRFVTEERILSAFSRSVGNVPLHGIDPAMITRFVNRGGTGVETIAKKHRVLAGFDRRLFREGIRRHDRAGRGRSTIAREGLRRRGDAVGHALPVEGITHAALRAKAQYGVLHALHLLGGRAQAASRSGAGG